MWTEQRAAVGRGVGLSLLWIPEVSAGSTCPVSAGAKELIRERIWQLQLYHGIVKLLWQLYDGIIKVVALSPFTVANLSEEI